MATITAHGTTYPSIAAAQERIDILRRENRQHGASDGRVTEINAIEAAIAERAQQRVGSGPVDRYCMRAHGHPPVTDDGVGCSVSARYQSL